MSRPLRLLTVIGARPQIIKAAAMGRAIRNGFVDTIQETLLHTGQHYDADMSQVFFEQLGLAKATVQLDVGSGAHGARTARMIEGIERELLTGRHDAVLLYGDTDSTLAGAIAASKLHVPVAHVEAGLRSFNKRMPEELNRITCDHYSTWLFCPTGTAVDNLRREGIDVDTNGPPTIDAPHVSLSGDVMYDNSLHFAAIAERSSTVLRDLGLQHEGYLLATMHRDHNTDVPERLGALFQAMLHVHEQHGLPIVLPLHPRTRKSMEALAPALQETIAAAAGIRMVPPVGFLDMIMLERHARLVMTDSGGVQKEAYFFGKPCVILRPETEWVELVHNGQAVLADTDPVRISAAVDHFLKDGIPKVPGLFGDGHAAERICTELLNTWSGR